MPITANTDTVRDLTVFKVAGVLTFEAVLFVVKTFYGGIPTKHVLWDFSGTTDVQLSSEEVEKISNFRLRYEGSGASGKTAFLAQKEVHFGLLRIFEIQTRYHEAPYTIGVFRKIDEAYRWFEKA